jgi:hypothetical protein
MNRDIGKRLGALETAAGLRGDLEDFTLPTGEECARWLRDVAVCLRAAMVVPQLMGTLRSWQGSLGTDDEPEARQHLIRVLVVAVRAWLTSRRGQHAECSAGPGVNAAYSGRPLPDLEFCSSCDVTHDEESIREAAAQMEYAFISRAAGPYDVAYLDHWRQVTAALEGSDSWWEGDRGEP